MLSEKAINAGERKFKNWWKKINERRNSRAFHIARMLPRWFEALQQDPSDREALNMLKRQPANLRDLATMESPSAPNKLADALEKWLEDSGLAATKENPMANLKASLMPPG